MKKILIIMLAALLCAGLAGCGTREAASVLADMADSASTAEAAENMEAGTDGTEAGTQGEGIAGTWNLYAGYDQSGELVYVNPESAEFTFQFDENNGFTGFYRQGDGYVNSTFSGVYDCEDSKAVEKDPYKWNYYATIDKNSIVDSGESSLLGSLGGEQGVHLIFKFMELDGEELLFEEMQSLYFMRNEQSNGENAETGSADYAENNDSIADEGQEISSGWPSDKLPANVPPITGATVELVMDMDGGVIISLGNLDPTVAENYANSLKQSGWSPIYEVTQEQDNTIIFEQGDASLTFGWYTDDNTGSIIYSIS